MGQTDLSDYKNLYLQTAKEDSDKILASLDLLSADVLNKKALDDLHIISHSLKSKSQLMGFVDIASTSESIEKISNNALLMNSSLTDKDIIGMKESLKELKEMLKPHFAEASRGKQVQNDKGVTV
ncbi:MAG: Hpt domain-containing protein [Candidatus Levybacteria bacterium]|nr:Hpt domain-containing protein [Candidatus Levybacteria bacterium]